MNPERQRLLCGERQVSGAQLREHAARAAAGFEHMGLAAGDTVAVMLRNDLAYLELMLALGRLGVHLVAINWHFGPAEAGFILRDCGARALVIHADLRPGIAAVIPEGLTVLEVTTPPDVLQAYGIGPVEPRMPEAGGWNAWLDGFAPSTREPLPSVGSMLYTSGTTGRPKAVMRLPGTPRQHAGALRIRAQASQARPGMRTAVVGPLYHAGPNAAARVALEQAELIAVMPRFDPEELLRLIDTHRLTHLSLVPIMMVRLLKLPEAVRARYDVSSLENVTHGGSPCAPEVKRRMLDGGVR